MSFEVARNFRSADGNGQIYIVTNEDLKDDEKCDALCSH